MRHVRFATTAACVLLITGTAYADEKRGCATPRPGVTALEAAAPAEESDPGSIADAQEERWEFTGTFYGWIPKFDGDITIGGTKSEVKSSISDTWDVATEDLETGIVGHVEAKRGQWGFVFDIMYLKFEMADDLDGVDYDVEPSLGFLELATTYDLGYVRYDAERADSRGVHVQAIGGARYSDIDIDLDVQIDKFGPRGRREIQKAIDGDREQDWWDAFVGFRATAELAEHTDFLVRADVGGFDIGTSSDFAWNVVGMVRHSFTPTVTAFAGWRWFDMDYDRGSGDSEFEWDVKMDGPLIGVTIAF